MKHVQLTIMGIYFSIFLGVDVVNPQLGCLI